MSYKSNSDFLALMRQTSSGVRTVRMPGLDYVLMALMRAGLITLQVSQSAPTVNQPATAWFKPNLLGSWIAEGTLFLYNSGTLQYEPANPTLWAALLIASAVPSAFVQDVIDPGPVNVLVQAGVVRVNQTIGAPVQLIMPLSANKIGSVLITDWKGDASVNNITVTLTGIDKFPGGLVSWIIANDTGSINLRPVPGGYAL